MPHVYSFVKGLISHFKRGIVVSMTTVSITDLKSNLSRYLREVRRGGEIQVLDRGTPVACITPPLASGDKVRNSLIRAGLVRPGKGRASEILDEPPLVLSVDLSAALSEERNDRL